MYHAIPQTFRQVNFPKAAHRTFQIFCFSFRDFPNPTMLNWIRPATHLWNRCYNLLRSSDHFINTMDTIKNVLNWSVMLTISLLIGTWIKLAITGLASFLPGNAPSWKVSWTAGIAIFTISCYCLEECVKMKRAQLPRAVLNPSRNEDEQ